MDKSFNDQELSDIMKEIEALEEDFSQPAAASEEALEEEEMDIAEVDAVIQELAELEEEHSIPVQLKKPTSVVELKPTAARREFEHSVPVTKAKAATAMSFKVQGDLNLEMQFEIGDKIVVLDISESGLTIQMDGGISFTVPVSTKKAS